MPTGVDSGGGLRGWQVRMERAESCSHKVLPVPKLGTLKGACDIEYAVESTASCGRC